MSNPEQDKDPGGSLVIPKVWTWLNGPAFPAPLSSAACRANGMMDQAVLVAAEGEWEGQVLHAEKWVSHGGHLVFSEWKHPFGVFSEPGY